MAKADDPTAAPYAGVTSKAPSAPSAERTPSAERAAGPTGATGTAGTTGAIPNGPTFSVLPPSEHDELTHRLRHAVSEFVDAPRGAVEEADLLLDELSARLTTLLADRRRTLREAWSDEGAGTARTEDLRLAMRGYRNVLERLLSV
ncbi:hypothetical protein [Streptomyces sp. ME19-01-6]|uniref:hypothetical protein n=1 Tax=Streptomyces sp. ME19-01-6 TaxID=3028686 RepID=UPI0029A8699C|nr:hypothetical protein [Streptomyces sp. ME19-01-6]MDX3224780.1 hypothetical protein [Streptomyces sp. ME19-01-6]